MESEILTSLRRVRNHDTEELATLILSMDSLADDEVSYNIVSDSGETLAVYTTDSIAHSVTDNLWSMGYTQVKG